jgi:hypothetical protein
MTRLSLLFSILTIGLLASTVAAKVCQVDTGCPKNQTVPACTPAQMQKAIPFGPGISTRTPPKSGGTVIFQGVLKQVASCKKRGCPPTVKCCNGCSGHVQFTGSGASSPDHYSTLRLTSDDGRFKIYGDDSLVCRPFAGPVEQAVVVEGTFQLKDGQYSIHNPTVCRL